MSKTRLRGVIAVGAEDHCHRSEILFVDARFIGRWSSDCTDGGTCRIADVYRCYERYDVPEDAVRDFLLPRLLTREVRV